MLLEENIQLCLVSVSQIPEVLERIFVPCPPRITHQTKLCDLSLTLLSEQVGRNQGR